MEKIPEIDLTKLQFQAFLLEGDDMYAPACAQKELAAAMLVDMLLRLAHILKMKSAKRSTGRFALYPGIEFCAAACYSM